MLEAMCRSPEPPPCGRNGTPYATYAAMMLTHVSIRTASIRAAMSLSVTFKGPIPRRAPSVPRPACWDYSSHEDGVGPERLRAECSAPHVHGSPMSTIRLPTGDRPTGGRVMLSGRSVPAPPKQTSASRQSPVGLSYCASHYEAMADSPTDGRY